MLPISVPPCVAVRATVAGGSYWGIPPKSGALISRLPLDPPMGMVMVVTSFAPRITPELRSRPRSSVTVWSAPKRTLLVIDTVAVAASPPSVSSVTSLLDASRSVKRQSGAGVVSGMEAFSPPPPMPFTARTSKVYSVPESRPSTT